MNTLFRKTAALLLCLTMTSGMAAMTAGAETQAADTAEKTSVSVSGETEVTYSSHTEDPTAVVESGECGNNVEYELHKNGALYIYGKGNIKNYDYYDSPFSENSTVVTVLKATYKHTASDRIVVLMGFFYINGSSNQLSDVKKIYVISESISFFLHLITA